MEYKIGDLVRVTKDIEEHEDMKGYIFEVNEIVRGKWYKDYQTGIGFVDCELEPVTHLTTKEFIKLVEDMGYEFKKYDDRLIIKTNGQTIAYVDKDEINGVCTSFGETINKCLFNLIVLYANTPLELREEKEQLYTLELPNNKHKNRFYCHQVSSKNYSFGKLNPDVNRQPDHIKHFTQKEIDELPNQELIKTLIKKEVKENE